MLCSRTLAVIGLISTIGLFHAAQLSGQEEQEPLYLHWFSPENENGEHVATLRIYPNQEFELSLPDQKSLFGKIQNREGELHLKAKATHVAPALFDTPAPLDKLLQANGIVIVSEGAAPFALVLSKNRDHDAALRAAVQQDADQNPEAARPVPLGWHNQRPVVKHWKFTDLEQDVKDLSGRSVERGRKAYEAARCMHCHHENTAFPAFGPHLGDLAKRYTGAELLRHTLEPSREIHADYHTHSFEMKDGRVVAGFIVKEDAREIHVVSNPIIAEESSVVRKADVESRSRSAKSTMPDGMLDRFQREEILDMLAFIQSAQVKKRQPEEKGAGRALPFDHLVFRRTTAERKQIFHIQINKDGSYFAGRSDERLEKGQLNATLIRELDLLVSKLPVDGEALEISKDLPPNYYELVLNVGNGNRMFGPREMYNQKVTPTRKCLERLMQQIIAE